MNRRVHLSETIRVPLTPSMFAKFAKFANFAIVAALLWHPE
jgi:hypothetical protein